MNFIWYYAVLCMIYYNSTSYNSMLNRSPDVGYEIVTSAHTGRPAREGWANVSSSNHFFDAAKLLQEAGTAKRKQL